MELIIVREYSFMFQQLHVNITHVFIVLSPRHVSVQFAPSSGGCSHLCLKNSVAVWFMKVCNKMLVVYNKIVKMLQVTILLYTTNILLQTFKYHIGVITVELYMLD